MLADEIEEFKKNGVEKDKMNLKELQKVKDDMKDKVNSLQNMLEQNIREETSKTKLEMDKIMANTKEIITKAFSLVQKDLLKYANDVYVLMKRVEAIESQIGFVPTLSFSHVSIDCDQT